MSENTEEPLFIVLDRQDIIRFSCEVYIRQFINDDRPEVAPNRAAARRLEGENLDAITKAEVDTITPNPSIVSFVCDLCGEERELFAAFNLPCHCECMDKQVCKECIDAMEVAMDKVG